MTNKKELRNWFDVHQEVGELLLEFSIKHPKNTAEELFKKLNTKDFRYANNWFAEGIKNYENNRLDPIQVFASFNHSTSTEASRIFKIKNLLVELDSYAEVVYKDGFFDGCPTVMISRVINTRLQQFQEEIWHFFKSVKQNGKEGLTSVHFEQFQSWYGISLASFTIFLYWVDAENFLPLDSNTRALLERSDFISKVPSNYIDYTQLCESAMSKDVFREIVKYAFINRQENLIVNPLSNEGFIFLYGMTQTELQNQLHEKRDETEWLHHPIRIIAIKPTREDQTSIKNLTADYYQFYNNYYFKDEHGESIKYEENKANYIYLIDGKKVSISAIVGKNASGKSTLTEILFLIINSLSIKKELNSELVHPDEKIHGDLYFFTNKMYKLSIGDEMSLYDYRYHLKNKTFFINDRNLINDFDPRQFFYTVTINYSLYGLNSKHIGEWITPLFHKNDGYQTPIVLNPKRSEGNINVNTEESLAKSRLLAFVLDWHRFELVDNEEGIISIEDLDSGERYVPERKTPELVENKVPRYLTIFFNPKGSKLLRYRNNANGTASNIDYHTVWGEIESLFKGEIKATHFVEEMKEYVFHKMINISKSYSKKYGSYVTDQGDYVIIREPVSDYLKALAKDTSHITFKFWQTVHYLFFGHLEFKGGNKLKISVHELAKKIEKIISQETQKREKGSLLPELKPITLIPPSIFWTDLLFSDNEHETLNTMSSGEKQHIFAINTVAYHLYNIDSIPFQEGLINYQYLNLLFDEVELYFHPDMQRKFIHDLLEYLKHIQWENMRSLNMTFITHSPFILSDIPASNILKLKLGKSVRDEQEPTFAANIHDLLDNDFFMDKGFMGEFARSKINDLIIYLTDKENYKAKFGWNIGIAKAVIDVIGEPYLKKDLLELYYQKIHQDKKIDEIDQEIEKLRELKKDLRRSK